MSIQIVREKPPNIYGVSEQQIRETLEKYRRQFPQDDRPDDELRPHMIHVILKHRMWLLK